MAWHEVSFGEALCSEPVMFSYSGLHNIKYEYIITTEGLVLRGGEFGSGSFRKWGDMDGPVDTDEGVSIGKINFKRTVCVHTINAKDFFKKKGDIKHNPEMSEEFYFKFLAARNIAVYFKDDPSYRIRALGIWKKSYFCSSTIKGLTKETLVSEIQQQIIKERFHKTKERIVANEMLSKGILEDSDFKKIGKIEQKVNDYIAKNRNAGQETEKNKSKEFRESYRVDETASGTIKRDRATRPTSNNRETWSGVEPHEEF